MNLNTIECQFTSENLCILDTQRGILDTQILISELHKLCKQKHISVWYIYTNTSKNVKLCIKTWIFLWCFKKFSCWVSWGRINLIWCASPSVSHSILPFLKSWWKSPSLTSIRFFKKMFVVSKQKWALFIWHPRDSKEVMIIHNFSKCHPGCLFKNGQRYCKTFSQVIFKIVGRNIWSFIYLKQCLWHNYPTRKGSMNI